MRSASVDEVAQANLSSSAVLQQIVNYMVRQTLHWLAFFRTLDRVHVCLPTISHLPSGFSPDKFEDGRSSDFGPNEMADGTRGEGQAASLVSAGARKPGFDRRPFGKRICWTNDADQNLPQR